MLYPDPDDLNSAQKLLQSRGQNFGKRMADGKAKSNATLPVAVQQNTAFKPPSIFQRPGHTNESLDERRSQAYNQPFSLPGESREIMLSITATAVCRGKVKPIAFLGTVNTLVPASTTISGMFLFL